MTDDGVPTIASVDFFNDPSIIEDPYAYFDAVREHGPAWLEPHHGVLVVTGHAEALQVYRDSGTFSSCNAASGPFSGLPVDEADGDITPLLERYGDQLPLHGYMATMDPPEHDRYRALMSRLFTPRRLRENEAFMWPLANLALDEFVADGKCEFLRQFSEPFTIMVIADLLGVPEGDRDSFKSMLASVPATGTLGEDYDNPMVFLEESFIRYVEDRRREPRDDVLTKLALATFDDGSMPEVIEIVREATFLFVAGQGTTALLLASALQYLGERPEIQQQLRERRDLIPGFVEEMLRSESPVKAHFRMARRDTSVGGVDVPAGTTVMLVIGAVNRDGCRFAQPDDFLVDRRNALEHIAFARGTHACLGQSLARAESRVALESVLDRMGDIRISESEHGPAGDRHYEYDPTYLFRGLKSLHLEFTPLANPR
jgi:cytochrome P450 family 150 subfamily A5